MKSGVAENRHEAKRSGERFYLGRRPCVSGHDPIRYTSTGGCVECVKMRQEAKKEEKRRYDRERYEASRDEVIKRSREYYENNRERCVEKTKEWVSANKELVREVKRSYKLRRKGMEADGATTREVAQWAEAQPKVCHWCGCDCEDGYHVDHYMPLAKGGKHEISNLVIACPTCNVRKNAKHPAEFAASIGRLL